ncbi:MAG: hypothetical protein JWR26_4952 [Pedosphaera sp.]|nr:hypothetical protein [Pedosphaera sp.]
MVSLLNCNASFIGDRAKRKVYQKIHAPFHTTQRLRRKLVMA